MKKFVIKLSVFIFIYLLVSNFLFLFVPYHYGNPWYSSKVKFLELDNNYEKYNTCFFGSSRVYRQINPNVFDSVVNNTANRNVKSFNLGAPATFSPQTYFLYKKFLKSELSRNVKTCFLELSNIQKIPTDQLGQERTNYYVNTGVFLFVVRSFFENKNIDFLRKIYYSSCYFRCYIENLFHLGHFKEALLTSNYYSKNYLGNKKDGFYPIDIEFSETKNKPLKDNFLKRREDLKDNLEVLYEKALLYKKNDSLTNKNFSSFDNNNLNKIMNLIQLSKDKGIHLFVILSPRTTSNELISLSKHIPEEHFINMSEPDKYPSFFKLKGSFDLGHFNSEGAFDYSKKIADAFLIKELDKNE